MLPRFFINIQKIKKSKDFNLKISMLCTVGNCFLPRCQEGSSQSTATSYGGGEGKSKCLTSEAPKGVLRVADPHLLLPGTP